VHNSCALQNGIGGASGAAVSGIYGTIRPAGVLLGLMELTKLGMGSSSRLVDLGAGLGG
jgi:hypothetical protein